MNSMETNSTRRIPVRGLLIAVISLLLAGFFAIPIFLSNMVIAGEEFCPQLFQKRDFFYYRIPGTKLRLGSTTLSPASSPCSTFILTHLSAKTPVEWHVSRASQGTSSTDSGPSILLEYLKSTNANGAKSWDDWSFRKPASAKVLWPIVQEAAEQKLYFCVPELLRNADSEADLQVLNRKLTVICIDAAILKMKSLSDLNEKSDRSKLRNWALSFTEDVEGDKAYDSRKTEILSLSE